MLFFANILYKFVKKSGGNCCCFFSNSYDSEDGTLDWSIIT